MTRKYKIDINELEESKKEREYDDFIRELYNLATSLEPIDFSKYETNDEKHTLLRNTLDLVTESLNNDDCDIKCTISNHGLIGTIKISCQSLKPENHSLFKGAVLAADSLEISSYLDGHVDISLTFFDMLKKRSEE